MRRTEALQGVRMIKFVDVLGRYEAAEFNQLEAAELLGIGERTFRRWRQRFEDDGEAGFWTVGWARRRASGFRCDREAEVEALYRSAIRASRPSIFTSIWCATTASRGATPGRRRFCNRRACWRRPSGAGRIGASGRAGRCRA